ncbi:MAG TPA: response regulator transcription factor [Slackia equolifaciens]|uniref:Response regulator transcription factor n=1 Tax=Slackia equolifaciens TaxID=498718 RepID=A0A9D3A1F3_9ACTN|nr:response regulator transcription factor [Slackia equolifaciens]
MRVLVVEDEEKLVAYLKKSLSAEGYVVDVAFDGISGLELALSGSYDAITLDVMLPGMNGYAVCGKIREAGIDTPVLMLTAKDGEYDEADALDMGADDFLRKPFSLVVLVARIRALVRRGGAARGASISVGDLTLDPAAKAVSRAGQPIALTPREFALLEYLMHNAGHALTKAQILEHVWSSGFMGDENVVEVYVGYLRKKIDAPFEGPLIRTVRGTGYMVSAEK